MNARQLLASLCLPFVAACAQMAPDPTPKPDGFWFIFLETGRKTPDDKALVSKMQQGHIENFKRLFGEQKLFAAGPLQDPSGNKRGIVVVKAPSREVLTTYFQADEYVRDGYMTLNAVPCVVRRALATEGIDPNAIEEVRIIQVLRSGEGSTRADAKADRAFLQSLIKNGTVGAWYETENGPATDVLFSRTTDTKTLQDAFAPHPGIVAGRASVVVWKQWLSKGVVK